MLTEALSFPRADERWLRTTLIGGGLTLFGFLVLPAIVVNGYLLRVVEAAVAGDEQPPQFDDWVDLFVDGVLVFVVEFVYAAIPAFIFAAVVGFVVAIGAIAGTSMDDPSVWLGIGVIAAIPVLAALLFVLLAAYLLPAALANFAMTGDLEAAFHVRTVARAAFTVDYAVAVLLAILVGIVLGLIGGLLVLILVGFFVLFYLQVVVYHLFGQGFARGLDLEVPAEAPDP